VAPPLQLGVVGFSCFLVGAPPLQLGVVGFSYFWVGAPPLQPVGWKELVISRILGRNRWPAVLKVLDPDKSQDCTV
jgi:hypothetical protein